MRIVIIFTAILMNFVFQEMLAYEYETKNYIWERLPDLITLNDNDTSIILYPKVQKTISGDIILGGLGYYTQYQRGIYRYSEVSGWSTIFSKNSSNMDYIINKKNQLIISGIKNENTNIIYIVDLKANTIDTVKFDLDSTQIFTKVIEYSDNKYLIKSNNKERNFIFLFDNYTKQFSQILPKDEIIDSTEKIIYDDLRFINDIIYVESNETLIVTSLKNMYFSKDGFKSIKFGFNDRGQFNMARHIKLNEGQFLYSHDNKFEDDYDSTSEYIIMGLYGIDMNTMLKKSILKHSVKPINNFGPFNPICLMACSNNNYIVCKLGGTYYEFGYGDSVNVDSLLVSYNNGKSFYFVPFPNVNFNYKYFAFAAPSISEDGEIFLAVSPRKADGTTTTAFTIHLYRGVPDTKSIPINIENVNNIFPNPAITTTRISLLQEGDISISAVDVLGRSFPLWSGFATAGDMELDVSTLLTGTYTVLINYGTKVKAVRMIKE